MVWYSLNMTNFNRTCRDERCSKYSVYKAFKGSWRHTFPFVTQGGKSNEEVFLGCVGKALRERGGGGGPVGIWESVHGPGDDSGVRGQNMARPVVWCAPHPVNVQEGKHDSVVNVPGRLLRELPWHQPVDVLTLHLRLKVHALDGQKHLQEQHSDPLQDTASSPRLAAGEGAERGVWRTPGYSARAGGLGPNLAHPYLAQGPGFYHVALPLPDQALARGRVAGLHVAVTGQ
jgi:hypothetical protein